MTSDSPFMPLLDLVLPGLDRFQQSTAKLI
jgi:hypothetical protein